MQNLMKLKDEKAVRAIELAMRVSRAIRRLMDSVEESTRGDGRGAGMRQGDRVRSGVARVKNGLSTSGGIEVFDIDPPSDSAPAASDRAKKDAKKLEARRFLIQYHLGMFFFVTFLEEDKGEEDVEHTEVSVNYAGFSFHFNAARLTVLLNTFPQPDQPAPKDWVALREEAWGAFEQMLHISQPSELHK